MTSRSGALALNHLTFKGIIIRPYPYKDMDTTLSR